MARTRLTKLGKVFLALMLLFYGAAVTSQSGLLLLLIGLIGGCFAVNWTFSRRNVTQLIVKVPHDVCLVEGSPLTQPWTIENPSRKHIEMIEAFAEKRLLFRIPLIEVEDAVSVVPRLIYQSRGVYPHSRMIIASAAPFGLLRSTRTLQLAGEVVVFPRAYDTCSPAQTGLDMIAGGRFRGSRRVNSGAHFAGVRNWQTGDALRQVHWKTTARRGELMVKTFEEELGGRVSLLLDCAPGDRGLVDDAVRAAASLATATLQEGHHLELFDSSEREPLRLAPFNDEGELLDRLARYEAKNATTPVDFENLWRRSALAIVGTSFRAEWLHLIQQAERQNRSVHIYLREQMQLPEMSAEIWEISSDKIVAAHPAQCAQR
jgi:uncharacterized protein (DUF58 family)